MREFRVNCYPTAVKRESLSSTRERRVSARCGVARRRTAASREVNLAKAVIKLISYLEDARMYCTDRESSRFASHSLARFLFNGLNYQRLSTPLFAYRPLFSFLSVSFSPPLSLSLSLAPLVRSPRSCLRPSSGYLLGFYLWSRSQCNRPIWTSARSNFLIIVDLLRTKLLPVRSTAGGERDGPVSVKEAKHSG